MRGCDSPRLVDTVRIKKNPLPQLLSFNQVSTSILGERGLVIVKTFQCRTTLEACQVIRQMTRS